MWGYDRLVVWEGEIELEHYRQRQELPSCYETPTAVSSPAPAFARTWHTPTAATLASRGPTGEATRKAGRQISLSIAVEQMDGKGVAQGLWSDTLGDACRASSLLDCLP